MRLSKICCAAVVMLWASSTAQAGTNGRVWRYAIVGAIGTGQILFEKVFSNGEAICTDKWWSIFDATTGQRKVAYPISKTEFCDGKAQAWTPKQIARAQGRIREKHGAVEKLVLLRIKPVDLARLAVKGPDDVKGPNDKEPENRCGGDEGGPALPHRRFRLIGTGLVVDVQLSAGRSPDLRDMNATGKTKPLGVRLAFTIKRGSKTSVATRRLAVQPVPACNGNQHRWPREGLTQAAFTRDGKALALVFDRVPFVVTQLAR